MFLSESIVEDAVLIWFGEFGDAIGHEQCTVSDVLFLGAMKGMAYG